MILRFIVRVVADYKQVLLETSFGLLHPSFFVQWTCTKEYQKQVRQSLLTKECIYCYLSIICFVPFSKFLRELFGSTRAKQQAGNRRLRRKYEEKDTLSSKKACFCYKTQQSTQRILLIYFLYTPYIKRTLSYQIPCQGRECIRLTVDLLQGYSAISIVSEAFCVQPLSFMQTLRNY